MKPPSFDYLAPVTIDEALAALSVHGDEAQLLAGGQSLVPMMALRMARPETLIDLNSVAGLTGIERATDTLRVGAMTRQSEVIASPWVAEFVPSLVDAMRLVGHFQTRSRGTLGGSISLADPSAEAGAHALAMDAMMELRSERGTRVVEAREYFVGAYTTAREPDELLTAVLYPIRPEARVVVGEVARRQGDFATAGLVTSIECTDGRITKSAMAWFSMGGGPIRSPSAEEAMNGMRLAALAPSTIADLAVGDTEPFDDHQASATLRRETGRALAIGALTAMQKDSRA